MKRADLLTKVMWVAGPLVFCSAFAVASDWLRSAMVVGLLLGLWKTKPYGRAVLACLLAYFALVVVVPLIAYAVCLALNLDEEVGGGVCVVVFLILLAPAFWPALKVFRLVAWGEPFIRPRTVPEGVRGNHGEEGVLVDGHGREAKVNRRQIIALWAGIAILVLVGLFPPWTRMYDDQVRRPAGYHFIMLPPASDAGGVEIDLVGLLIEWGLVVFVVGGLIVTFRRRPPPAH